MRRLARTVAGWFSLTSERGVTAIEYGIIAMLLAVVIIGGVTLVGNNLDATATTVAGKLK